MPSHDEAEERQPPVILAKVTQQRGAHRDGKTTPIPFNRLVAAADLGQTAGDLSVHSP
jgi:hypothetical protein